MRKSCSVKHIWHSLALALLLSVPILAQNETVTLNFTKEDPDGDATWDGTVSGDVEGELQTVLLNADQTEPVWLVAFEGIVTAGDRSFRAHVGGTLDTTTGQVHMSGVVTEGYLLGAAVDWQGQMVDEQASRFEGTITLTPPRTTGGGGQTGGEGSTEGTASEGTALSGQVQNWEGDEGRLVLLPTTAPPPPRPQEDALELGNVAADGSFNLTLPESMPEENLVSVARFLDGDPCDELTVTPEDARFLPVNVGVYGDQGFGFHRDARQA